MKLSQELFEMFMAIVPILPALYITAKPAKTLPGWVGQVIATCFVALLGTGLTLMRLTANCSSTPVECAPGLIISNRIPGMIDSCGVCAKGSPGALASAFNEWALTAQATTGAICLIVSILTMIRFIIWARRHQTIQPR